jgi:hypothetical protein
MNFTYPKKRKLKKSQSDYYLPNLYLNIPIGLPFCLQLLSDGQKKMGVSVSKRTLKSSRPNYFKRILAKPIVEQTYTYR